MCAISMYAGQRHVKVAGAVADAGRPQRGILPGCCHAMALLRVHLAPTVRVSKRAGASLTR
eukprot:3262004-Lingulodinium_polyedra.AAC.1